MRQGLLHRFSRPLRTLSLLIAVALIAGCGGLFTSRTAAPTTYVLRPEFAALPRTALTTVERKGGQAVVQLVSVAAAPGYATDAILATLPERRLDIFAASRWPEPLPRVVASLALQALVAGGVAAHDAAAPVAATHLLRITLRRFDAQYAEATAAPVVRVVLDAVVLRRADRQIVAAFTTEAEVTAATNRMAAIVAAFEAAAAEALSHLTVRVGDVITQTP